MVERLWLRSAPRGSGMGQTGAVSVMPKGPFTSVSAHALQPLPIRGKPFHAVPWKEVEAGKAGEVKEDVWDGFRGYGLAGRIWGLGRLPPHPSLNFCL